MINAINQGKNSDLYLQSQKQTTDKNSDITENSVFTSGYFEEIPDISVLLPDSQTNTKETDSKETTATDEKASKEDIEKYANKEAEIESIMEDLKKQDSMGLGLLYTAEQEKEYRKRAESLYYFRHPEAKEEDKELDAKMQPIIDDFDSYMAEKKEEYEKAHPCNDLMLSLTYLQVYQRAEEEYLEECKQEYIESHPEYAEYDAAKSKAEEKFGIGKETEPEYTGGSGIIADGISGIIKGIGGLIKGGIDIVSGILKSIFSLA